jgi:hypothetical protein
MYNETNEQQIKVRKEGKLSGKKKPPSKDNVSKEENGSC